MRRLSSVAPAHGKPELCLPGVVEELLVEVADDGFTLYCCGPRSAPNALLATYAWAHYVDLLTTADFDRVTTAQAPTTAYPAPARLHVPRTHQRPMTIQPPTPGRAGMRAARLATAITTVGDSRAVTGLARAEADDLRLVAGGAGGPRR